MTETEETPPKLPLEGIPSSNDARKSLKDAVTRMRLTLTEAEAAFLHALLIDPPGEANISESEQSKQIARAAKVLDDDVLFSLPFEARPAPAPPKVCRPQSNFIGLWRAFQDGVKPKTLVKRASSINDKDGEALKLGASGKLETIEDEDDDGESIPSDVEVRVERADDEESTSSSWNEDDGGINHYDAWAVLKDEYAQDFGFDYSEKGAASREGLSDEERGNTFRILGTSADDVSARPHVLSPPLMDSLMNFFPEILVHQNFWLKYSLVRDGASMNTFKRYVRGSTYTVLAIETTHGDVFGSFTSSPWRTQYGFFGSGKAFLWKMRHNRSTPCASLFDQAQMESEIDVYAYSGLNDLVQMCGRNMIAVGGGTLPKVPGEDEAPEETSARAAMDSESSFGFGIAIDDDLLHGTTSPCATFRSPCLVHHSSRGNSFKIVNMEVWTMTPCFDVKAAEQLEMTKFFVEESTRLTTRSANSERGEASPFSSRDLVQERFFRRVGMNDENEEERDLWQYANMMNNIR